MKKKILLMVLLMIFLIGLVTAVISNMNITLSKENKDTLLRVGHGIGNNLKLLENGCDGSFCYFTLFEEGGINKEFKVKLEQICNEMGMCEDLDEEYECCLEWRDETDEEVLSKAGKKAESILNNIVDVTLDRESRSKIKRFEDIDIII